jgi:hypothetical protein
VPMATVVLYGSVELTPVGGGMVYGLVGSVTFCGACVSGTVGAVGVVGGSVTWIVVLVCVVRPSLSMTRYSAVVVPRGRNAGFSTGTHVSEPLCLTNTVYGALGPLVGEE